MVSVSRLVLLGAAIPLAAALAISPRHDDEPAGIPPIVSAKWVSDNLAMSSLVVVDLRPKADYAKGHVPSSISIPYEDSLLWRSQGVVNDTLIMPTQAVITETLSANGILDTRNVVFVSDVTSLPVMMSMATRSAATLRYAGISPKSLAILDGGYTAWKAAGLAASMEATMPRPGTYAVKKLDSSFIVDRAHVKASLNMQAKGVVLLDGRDTQNYNSGHIESALSLTAISAFQENGMWKSTDELTALFKKAVGDIPVTKTEGELIIYCRIGMLASVWVYVLTDVLGYENVKLYDGSIEDWVKMYELVQTPML